ncbi:MAG: ATP-binding protein [Acholeplasmatales bacterium]|nr:ATP-binding protein [Acholeplasmatales bacterium]
MSLNSPFNVSFGEKPNNLIERNDEFNQITSVFDSENPETKIMIITGARGVGKTVLLSSIKKNYDNQKNWLCVDTNPNIDILEQVASKIYEFGKVKKLFLKAEFNFSFKGVGFSIVGDEPVSSIQVLLEKMFSYLKRKNIKVLVTLDDIASNQYVRTFAHAYQSFIREGYLLYFLATGLYENIEKLSNEKNLTFLTRSTKIYLGKLNMKAITYSYMDVFNIEEDDALRIAKQTNGYAYGFQLLGSILYKSDKKKIDSDVLKKYDLYLDDNSYSLIWNSLSKNEKIILFSMINTNSSIKEIIEKTGLTNSAIQVYKKQLVRKGLVDDSTRGKLTFVLPRFNEFVTFQYKLENLE